MSATKRQPWDCNHANEVPNECPCKEDCYCRVEGSCRNREADDDFAKNTKTFEEHLAWASKEVASWPEWKRNLLGRVLTPTPSPEPVEPPQLMKVNFCIPPLGTKIVLAEPWTFDLYYESRNEKLIETLGLRKKVKGPTVKRKATRNVYVYPAPGDPNYGQYYNRPTIRAEEYEYDETPEWWEWDGGVKPSYGGIIKKVTLPRGSKLSVQRIYIRCGGAGIRAYNSVTFTLMKGRKKRGEPVPPHGRFWAKLHDVNRIVCYPVGSDPDVNAVWTPAEKSHLRTFKFLDINEPLD